MKKKEKKIIEANIKKTKEINKQDFNISLKSKNIVMGLIGLILLFLPEESNKFIGIIIGGSLLLVGAIIIIKYLKSEIKTSSLNLVSGVLYSVLGLIIIIYPLSIMRLATIILGVYLIVNGALKVHSGYLTHNEENSKWQSLLIAGTIIVCLGIVLVINPFSGLFVTKIAGAFLLIVSIYDLITNE